MLPKPEIRMLRPLHSGFGSVVSPTPKSSSSVNYRGVCAGQVSMCLQLDSSEVSNLDTYCIGNRKKVMVDPGSIRRLYAVYEYHVRCGIQDGSLVIPHSPIVTQLRSTSANHLKHAY